MMAMGAMSEEGSSDVTLDLRAEGEQQVAMASSTLPGSPPSSKTSSSWPKDRVVCFGGGDRATRAHDQVFVLNLSELETKGVVWWEQLQCGPSAAAMEAAEQEVMADVERQAAEAAMFEARRQQQARKRKAAREKREKEEAAGNTSGGVMMEKDDELTLEMTGGPGGEKSVSRPGEVAREVKEAARKAELAISGMVGAGRTRANVTAAEQTGATGKVLAAKLRATALAREKAVPQKRY